MLLLVCTKHCVDLVPTERITLDDGTLAALMLDVDEVAEREPSDDEVLFKPYMFDLSGFYCPDNPMEAVAAGTSQDDLDAYHKALNEADCSEYYCVVDADTMYPLEDFIETRAYHINWAERYN